jgi:hypothetical protein
MKQIPGRKMTQVNIFELFLKYLELFTAGQKRPKGFAGFKYK